MNNKEDKNLRKAIARILLIILIGTFFFSGSVLSGDNIFVAIAVAVKGLAFMFLVITGFWLFIYLSREASED